MKATDKLPPIPDHLAAGDKAVARLLAGISPVQRRQHLRELLEEAEQRIRQLEAQRESAGGVAARAAIEYDARRRTLENPNLDDLADTVQELLRKAEACQAEISDLASLVETYRRELHETAPEPTARTG